MTRYCRAEVAAGVYAIVLVAFSPAIANQYLAIPVSGIAILGVGWFIPYIVVATLALGRRSLGFTLGSQIDRHAVQRANAP